MTCVCRLIVFGSSIWKPDATPVEVLYLADKDVKATRKHASATIRQTRRELRQARVWQQEREMVGDGPSTGVQYMVETLEKEIPALSEKQQVVKAMPFVLGKILLSSGKSLGIRK